MPRKYLSAVTQEMYAMLAKTYTPATGHALFYEVADAAGFGRDRSLDACVFNLWPSRGFILMGIEVKTIRGDWLKEMRTPEKADIFYRLVDEFYLAVSDPDIVKPGELPKEWGLMVPARGKLTIKVSATRHKGKGLTGNRDFIAAMLKSVTTRTPIKEIEEAARKEGYEQAMESQRKRGPDASLHAQVNRLEKTIKEFEEETGIPFESQQWRGGKRFGEAVNFVMHHDIHYLLESLEVFERTVHSTTEDLRKVVKEYEK